MYKVTNEKNKTISFAIYSKKFNFGRLIEQCKNFLSQLGFYEISNIYIVLRELLFNTILCQAKSDTEFTLDCNIVYKGDGKFEIILTGYSNESDCEYFDWVSQYSPTSTEDRSNTLIHSISEKIDLAENRKSITAYVVLEKTNDYVRTGTDN